MRSFFIHSINDDKFYKITVAAIALMLFGFLVSPANALTTSGLDKCFLVDGKLENPNGTLNCSVTPNLLTDWTYTAGNYFNSGTRSTEAEIVAALVAGAAAVNGASSCGSRLVSSGTRSTIYPYAEFFEYGKFPIRSKTGPVNIDTCLLLDNNVPRWSKGVFTADIYGLRSAGCTTPFDNTEYRDPARGTFFCAGPIVVPFDPPICMAKSSDGSATRNPIIPATGEKIKDETDYEDNSAHPLSVTRRYRGNRSEAGALSRFWSHDYFGRLRFSVSQARIVFGDGRVRTFTNPNGSITIDPAL